MSADVVLVGLVALGVGLVVGWMIAAHQERKYVEDLERRLELLRRIVRMPSGAATVGQLLQVIDACRPAHVPIEVVLRELHVAVERRRSAN